MYRFCKICHLSSVVLTKRTYNICPKRDIKSLSTICTSTQKLADVSQPQNNNILVYEAPLKTRVKVVKYISLSTSMMGVAIFPTAMLDLSKGNMLVAGAAGTISLFILSTPLLLNWVTKRYVIQLHFDRETKTFTAKTFNIVNKIVEIKFKAEDVTVPDLPGAFSSFTVHGRPLFVDANLIQDADAYSHMMGYDKPFNFAIKIDEQNDNNKT